MSFLKFIKSPKTIIEADNFAPNERPVCSKCETEMELFCSYICDCEVCNNCSEGLYVCPNCEPWFLEED